MKKFYSALALAAAVTLSATAADVNRRVSIQKVATLDIEEVEGLQAQRPARAPQKTTPAASNIEELKGIYTAKLVCPFEGYGETTREYAILPGDDADHIKIIGLAPITIVATVNYAGGIITIPALTVLPPEKFKDDAGNVQEYDCFLSHMIRNAAGELERSEDGLVWVILEDGEIAYDDAYDYLMYEVGPGSGYFPLYSGRAFELKKQVEPETEAWETVGKARFIDDGFYMPLWTFNKEGLPEITCDLQRDKNKPEHLRLYNAYGNLNKDVSEWLGITNPDEYEILNEENLPGSIYLNAEFTYCVGVPKTYIGVCYEGLWYGANMESGSLEGSDPEEQAQALLNSLGADRLSMIDYDNKMAVIRNCEFSCDMLGSDQTWKTLFGNAQIPTDCTETVTILLPEELTAPSALGAIKADENAPVEYFNLQGVRIDNPGSGLYIRRQGNNVTKVVR